MVGESQQPGEMIKRRATGADMIIALFAVVLFVSSLWGAWVASRQTEYPPIHDVLSYTTKAENVWNHLRAGRFTGLLGVEQTIRPFGTSLIGYPLGYNDDFRAFYWRTVAIPAFLCALAAFVAALAAGSSWREPSAWLLASLGGMLPMWWAFDPMHSVRGITYWGMMDGMQAATAALATALLLFGWRKNALMAALAGFVLSAFTLLLKPVGVFLIAGQMLAALILLIWSFRHQNPSAWWRFALGSAIGVFFCACVGIWCYFSPYFSAANQEMGRQALDQLKALGGKNAFQIFFDGTLPKLLVRGTGLVSLAFFAACALQYAATARAQKWVGALPVAAMLVLTLLLAALYQGTHFLTARYFLPAIAVTWALLSPLLWFLLHGSKVARLVVVLNAAVLAASVWFPNFAKKSHAFTGYATFTSEVAKSTAKIAAVSVEKSPKFGTEPVVYVLSNPSWFEAFLVAHQLVYTGGWKENVLWKYAPRIWEKHTPAIHPHEIAAADFLVLDTDVEKSRPFPAISEALKVLQSADGLALAPVLQESNGIAVRRVADPMGLEGLLAAKLGQQRLLPSGESGSVEAVPNPTPLAGFRSGDELLEAKADWAEGKLRVTSTWSGARSRKDHLAMSYALLDSNGVAFHWIQGSLLPPPSGAGESRRERTVVDELDCAGFRDKPSYVAIGVYDRSARTTIDTAPTHSTDPRARIPISVATDSVEVRN